MAEVKLLTIHEFAEKHKHETSEWKIRQAVRKGELPSARWGAKIYIPEDALETFLRRQLAGTPAGTHSPEAPINAIDSASG